MKHFSLFLLIASLLVSCGGNGDTSGKAGSEAPSLAYLTISGNDLMQYDKNELRVKAGQKVTLTLKHSGQMSKEVMGHNFVLLKPGTDLMAFGNKAGAAVDTDYIPEGDEILVHTKMIGGGESTTITFDAPPAGTYDFLCSFPGHFAIMKGKFIVE